MLVGGGVRVPIVQQTLKDFVGEGKIAQNVNQDEAAVLGAGFRAAALSTSFRVREIMVKDKCLFPVRVDYATEPKGKKVKIIILLFIPVFRWKRRKNTQDRVV